MKRDLSPLLSFFSPFVFLYISRYTIQGTLSTEHYQPATMFKNANHTINTHAASLIDEQLPTKDLIAGGEPKHVEHTENINTSRESVSIVLGLVSSIPRIVYHDRGQADITKPELLTSILSYLSIKELTRIFTVSKHWHQVIHNSPELRRKLFLDATQKREYLERRYTRSNTYTHGLYEVQSFITKQRGQFSRLIIEPHPALLHEHDHIGDECIVITARRLSHNKIKSVPPSTLLFQPPVEAIDLDFYGCTLPMSRTNGVTFGLLVDELEGKVRSPDAVMGVPGPAVFCGPEGYLDLRFLIDDAVVVDDEDAIQARDVAA